jgi:nitric oxide reductase NorD protein
VDRLLANELPGLRSSLARVRRAALDARLGRAPLSPRERFVENAIRRLLGERIEGDAPPLDDFPRGVPEVARVAAWARDAARASPRSPYRGAVTVPHWGCARPDLAADRRRGGTLEGGAVAPGEARSRKLSRRVEPRDVEEDETDTRQGPFLLPFGDPQQSIQDPSGLRRPEDRGADVDLDALVDQLERLDRLARVRSETDVREVLEADEDRRAGIPAARTQDDPGAIAYPEWDYRTRAYRAGRCRLRERPAPAGEAGWAATMLAQHRALLAELKRRFEAFRPRRLKVRREREGAELDLDAYVEDFADRLAGRGPDERLYVRERALRRDVSVAFLIDASGSTESWVGAGRRVIDVEKEAALVLCEALEALGDRYALYAFSGRGPAGVRVLRVKAFAEAYGEDVRRRIAGVQCDAFTRIGGPLRHVTALLARERSRLRLLFLLSDGKPNDVDEYEGDYGIEDTRQAIAEARLQGVEVFCLTVDREGSTYLPRMFGPRGFGMMTSVSQLPERLPEIYRRITSR